MTDDDLEQRLESYAQRWRATVPVPPLPDLPPRSARRRPHPALFVIGTAAAVSVVVMSVAVTGGVGPVGTASSPASSPSSTTTPTVTGVPSPSGSDDPRERGGVVPWAPVDPTYPRLPRVTTGASPDPTAAAAARPCGPGDLRATTQRDGATGGVWVLGVAIHASSAGVTCHLQGYPSVRLLDHGRDLRLSKQRTPQRHSYSAPVLVDSESVATVSLYWGGWCSGLVTNDRVELGVGDGYIRVKGFGMSPGCGNAEGDGGGPAPVVVGSFQPQGGFATGKVTGPFHDTVASLATLDDPVPGQTLRFVVTLTAPRDVPLDPCPDYTLGQWGSWDDISEARYALNCAAVPYRRPDGTPYLPAGVAVPFAMELGLLRAEAGAPKAIWHLEGTGIRLAIPTGTR